MKHYIGIDNGVTGSICILDEDGRLLFYGPTPVEKTLNYTKAKEYVTRVKGDVLASILESHAEDATLILERPMINPQRWKASVSAIRCDEATRTVIEMLGIKFMYVDSKEWQKDMLPKRTAAPRVTKGMDAAEKKAVKARAAAYKTETKELSLAVGKRLFPKADIKKDADAALMAEWCRRNNL